MKGLILSFIASTLSLSMFPSNMVVVDKNNMGVSVVQQELQVMPKVTSQIMLYRPFFGEVKGTVQKLDEKSMEIKGEDDTVYFVPLEKFVGLEGFQELKLEVGTPVVVKSGSFKENITIRLPGITGDSMVPALSASPVGENVQIKIFQGNAPLGASLSSKEPSILDGQETVPESENVVIQKVEGVELPSDKPVIRFEASPNVLITQESMDEKNVKLILWAEAITANGKTVSIQ